MLDPSRRFAAPEMPHVDVYPDHEAEGRFYAVPKAPRVVRSGASGGQKGTPQINLLVYTRKDGRGPQSKAAPLAGGQVSLTVAFSLLEEERRALERSLQGRLARTKGARGVAPVVVSPDWLAGRAAVQLTDDLRLEGTPSLMGENTCSLAGTLDAAQADGLRRAWEGGLKRARIYYSMEARAASSRSASATWQAHEQRESPAASARASISLTGEASLTQAARHVIEAEGPLGVSSAELAAALQVINL